MKLWKKQLPLLLCMLMMCALLGGCVKKGRLDEGECKCTVSFLNLPKEFTMLEENVRENFAIHVTLRNITTETHYQIELTEDKDFTQELSLHPGVYQVYAVYTNQAANTGMVIDTKEDSITLSPDIHNQLHVYLVNSEEFTQQWMAIQPMPEIRLANKFDGIIQLNRKLINLRTESAALIQELGVTSDEPVKAYEKIELTNEDLGITITLQNQTDEETDYTNCKVIGINVKKNTVVFPLGVTLGMAPGKICHTETGIYGEPDSFSGSLLYGMGLENTKAIYNDPHSGDRLTIQCSADGRVIHSIQYDLERFEN